MVAQAAAGIFWPGPQGAKNGDYQIKFLADQIVRAPFWHAQRMLSESHQPNIVGGFHRRFDTARKAAVPFFDWMAAVSDDGRTLVLRTQNPNPVPVLFTVRLLGGPWSPMLTVRTLAGKSLADGNDFASPAAVAPHDLNVTMHDGHALSLTVVPFSFSVITATTTAES